MDGIAFGASNLGDMNPRRLVTPRERPPMANRIRDARIAKGMSQEALARAVDVISTSISRFERGVFRPDETTLARIADVLGVSAEWLRYGIERPHIESIDVVPPQFEEWLQSPLAVGATEEEIDTLRGFRFPYGHPGMAWYAHALIAMRAGKLGVPPQQ